jgi:hypothetical protein
MPDILRKLIDAGWQAVAPYLVRSPVEGGAVSFMFDEYTHSGCLLHHSDHASGTVEWLIEFGPDVPTEIIFSTCRLAQTQPTD